MLCFTFC